MSIRPAPFIAGSAAGLSGSLVGHLSFNGYLVGALATLVVSGGLMWISGRRSNPDLGLIGALIYLGSVFLLVQGQGGTVHSGSGVLGLLPVLWVALYCPRAHAATTVAASTANLWLLSVLSHTDAAATLRRCVLWLLVVMAVTLAVQQLRQRHARLMSERNAKLEETRTLSRAVRELTELRDTDAILSTGTRVVAELVSDGDPGKRRASYFRVIDGAATLTHQHDESGFAASGTWPLSHHPNMNAAVQAGRAVAGTLDLPTLGPRSRDAFVGSAPTPGAWVPVSVAGELHGVLSVSGRGEAISEDTLELLESVAGVIQLALENAAAHEIIELAAQTDALTACANRRGLMTAHPKRPYTLIAADLDGLKAINDGSGHEAGDAALVRFAEVARSVLRPGDLVARTGGDEFVIVLNDADPSAAWQVAARLLSAMTAPGADLGLRASLGIAASAPDVTFDEVLARADEAMYRAKRNGGMRAAEYELSSAS